MDLPSRAGRLSNRALNRALLARQGLLEPIAMPLVDVVEAIGAMQAQYGPALPVALCSRMKGFEAEHLYDALGRETLVVATLIRRTLHLVSARQYPAYAAVVEAAGLNAWRRTGAAASGEIESLRASLLAALHRPRTAEQISAFIEEWVVAHPAAFDEKELTIQRKYNWRSFYTWSALVRAPADGRWSARAPTAFRAAPLAQAPPDAETALADVIRYHLRAFGPAAPDDVATWIGWSTAPVRKALERLEPTLHRFADETKRILYDLPGSPRPDPGAGAPVRFLPAFDSTLLAYARGHRERILPGKHKDAVYVRANLRLLPTVLVDGFVAGVWDLDTGRRSSTLTVRLLEPVSRAAEAAVEEEAARILRFAGLPDSKGEIQLRRA